MIIVQGINDQPPPRPDVTDLWVISGRDKAAYIMKGRGDQASAKSYSEDAAWWRLSDIHALLDADSEAITPHGRAMIRISLDALATSFHELLGITERWADVFKEMDALRFRVK